MGKQIENLSDRFYGSRNINKQIWEGKYWGPEGALDCHRTWRWIRVKHDHVPEVETLSAASSVYYSAHGNALTHASEHRWFGKWYWCWRALWCLFLANYFSGRLVKQRGELSKLTTAELDIRASVLRRTRRFKAAERCVRLALTRADLSLETKALLWITAGECLTARKEYQHAAVMVHEAVQMVGQSSPTVQVRVYRGAARFEARYGDQREAERLWHNAARLADTHGLNDQRRKIEAEVMKYLKPA